MNYQEQQKLQNEEIKIDVRQSEMAEDPFKDNFFMNLENTKPFFKAAFEGFAGSGKTYTTALVVIGLYKKIKSQKPIVIFDTEKAAKFLKPMFEKEGINVLVRDSRSVADLKETMKRCREGAADILIIDSISHLWEDFTEAYKRRVNRTNLQFQDWGILKPTWKREFSDPFVRDPYHILMCGRAGFEYEYEKNENTGKKELIKSGVKMKVEGETAYEPDLLILMERLQEMDGSAIKSVAHRATVIKDRSTLIDGKTFENPGFKEFEPVIDCMLSSPVKPASQAEYDSAQLFKVDEDKRDYVRERDKWLEEIEGYLVSVWPGQAAKEKKLKTDAIAYAFNTYSWTAVSGMSPKTLQAGFEKIKEFVAQKIKEEQELLGAQLKEKEAEEKIIKGEPKSEVGKKILEGMKKAKK